MKGIRHLSRKTPAHRNPKLLLTTPGIPGECRFCKKTILHPKTNGLHVFLRDAGVCAKCGHQENHRMGNWQADHIIPLALGGSFDLSNLQTLCNTCHFTKSKQELPLIRQERRRNP